VRDDRHGAARRPAAATETLLKAFLRAFRLELSTDAGKVNYRLIFLSAAFMIVAGAPNLLEQVIAIWAGDYTSDFPAIPALAILMGGGLICVLMLVLVEPLLPTKQPRDEDR
jgi:hypothetical protein